MYYHVWIGQLWVSIQRQHHVNHWVSCISRDLQHSITPWTAERINTMAWVLSGLRLMRCNVRTPGLLVTPDCLLFRLLPLSHYFALFTLTRLQSDPCRLTLFAMIFAVKQVLKPKGNQSDTCKAFVLIKKLYMYMYIYIFSKCAFNWSILNNKKLNIMRMYQCPQKY